MTLLPDWWLPLIALVTAALAVYVVRQIGYRAGHAEGYAAGYDAGYRHGGLTAARAATHNRILAPAILRARQVGRRTEAANAPREES